MSGLAGFVDVHRPIEFSLLLNGGFGQDVGVVQREPMADAIGAYPDAPTADELVPAPATTPPPPANDDVSVTMACPPMTGAC